MDERGRGGLLVVGGLGRSAGEVGQPTSGRAGWGRVGCGEAVRGWGEIGVRGCPEGSELRHC